MKFIRLNILFPFLVLVALNIIGISANVVSNGMLPQQRSVPFVAFREAASEADSVFMEDTEIESDSLVYHDAQDSLLVSTENLGIRINRDADTIGNAIALSRFFGNMLSAQSDVSPGISIYHIGDSHVAGKYYPNSVAKHLHDLYGEGKTTVITPKIKIRAKHSTVHRGKKGKHSKAVVSGTRRKRSAKAPSTVNTRKAKKRKLGSAFLEQSLIISGSVAMLQLPVSGLESRFSPGGFQTEAVTGIGGYQGRDTTLLPKITINYTAYGVPGKSFKYFCESPATRAHLAMYKPHLVIISLGVNDIFGKRIDKEYIEENLARLVALVRQDAPGADILLGITTDAYVKKKKSNPFLPELKKLMVHFAVTNNCAYWDPVPVFGGYGCMNRWYKQNLCVRDKVHLTATGYTLLGEMLVEALDKSFTTYAANR